ncbi:MAG TPA: DHA2 family efflux MFS transporter permease subunit [Steroidobacteraceae bacterium]|nr:DHA2 family efflux MFS transporter permease subunit [Steroidobacteraceae bacterium]
MPPPEPATHHSLRLWLGFGAMCVGMFMAILDIQVVASSLTTIGDALELSKSQLGWIQTSYLMAEVIAIPLTGLLTRALSLRGMFATATFAFTLASIGCALSDSIGALIAFRVAQGFFAGMLIPAVFTAVFTLMPERHRLRATTIAGVFALLAPTLGPLVGGYLTQTHSWHWIFLINIAPGLAVTVLVAIYVRIGAPDRLALRCLDLFGLAFFATSLALLELLLNEGPRRHWQGEFVVMALAACLVSGALGIWRCLTTTAPTHPFVDLKRFGNVCFAAGCLFSFVLGLGLFGSIFIMSLFLGLVREHSPLLIGEILMVTGIAQLLTAPLSAWAETHAPPRLLTTLGFGLFGAGLLANGFVTPQSDFAALLWPQVLRGGALMLCLLPTTRLALDIWPAAQVPEASALFNLVRNLGGAVGIALIDTMVAQRTSAHVAHLVTRLQAGDPVTARFVGLPVALFHNRPMAPVDAMTRVLITPLIERAALTQVLNEAWITLAILFALSLLALPLMGRRGVGELAKPSS